MKSLCLVCKALQLLMTPFLYQNIVIRLGHLNTKFDSTIQAVHPGIPCIGTLHITRARYTPLGRRVATLIRLLNAISMHSLTRFEYVQYLVLVPSAKSS